MAGSELGKNDQVGLYVENGNGGSVAELSLLAVGSSFATQQFAGTRVVGQAWPQIMARCDKLEDLQNPHVDVRVGNPGDTIVVDMQCLTITASGPASGAILMEWNIHEATQRSTGLWDTRFRVGGARGTALQHGRCASSGFAPPPPSPSPWGVADASPDQSFGGTPREYRSWASWPRHGQQDPGADPRHVGTRSLDREPGPGLARGHIAANEVELSSGGQHSTRGPVNHSSAQVVLHFKSRLLY